MPVLPLSGLGQVVAEVVSALVPLLVLLAVGQVTVMRLRAVELRRLAAGFLLAGTGLVFFLQGVHVTFLPVGRDLGEALVRAASPWWLVPVGFLVGFTATLAEPAVRILIEEIQRASALTVPRQPLLISLSLGVGAAVALAMARVILGLSLWSLLLPGYLAALLITRYVEPGFVSIAFDAGGVATGPLTVTFIAALGIGAAAGFPGRDPLLDGFGLVALVALTPILSVLAVGLLYARKTGKETRVHGPS